MLSGSRSMKKLSCTTRDNLQATLRKLGCYVNANENRFQALRELEGILNVWSTQLRNRELENDADAEIPGISLVSFGSYRLAVHNRSSDLDLIALCPPWCSREDFFDSLVGVLNERPTCRSVNPIPTAYTPVIKFLLCEVKIDLLFVRLNTTRKLLECQKLQASLGKNRKSRVEYYIEDSDLIGLDEVEIRSINGARVSQRLLELVPSVDDFRMVLMAVKAWAKNCGVQSNVLGFLGGINWAILVAWICGNKQADFSEPSKLLYLFFVTFAKWKWPDPVYIEPPRKEPPFAVKKMQCWDPEETPRDELHLMPIITPAYPNMNSSYSVGIPQLRRMQDEMYRAAYALKESSFDCSVIFQDCGFFQRHCNFLQVIMSAHNKEDLLLWGRLCETKLRILISALETDDVQAWPFGTFFERPINDTSLETKCEMHFFIAIRFAPGIENVDLRDSASDFLNRVNSWEGRCYGMDLEICRITADAVPSFVLTKELKVDEAATLEAERQAKRQKL